MSTAQAWNIAKERSTWRHAMNPPRPLPNTTIIVFERGVCRGPMGPQIQLNPTNCARGYYEFWFVPTNARSFDLTEQVSSTVDGAHFQVRVQGSYKVENAIQVATQHADDLPAAVETEIRHLVSEHRGQYAPDSRHHLEVAIKNHLQRRSHLETGVQIFSLLVNVSGQGVIVQGGIEILRVEQELRVQEIKHRQTLQQMQMDNQKVQLQRQQEIEKQRHDTVLLNMRMEQYENALQRGRTAQFALLLAQKDDQTLHEVVFHFENQRERDIATRWELFKEMVKGDDSSLLATRLDRIVRSVNAVHNPLVDSQATSPASGNRLLEDDHDLFGQLHDEEDLSDGNTSSA